MEEYRNSILKRIRDINRIIREEGLSGIIFHYLLLHEKKKSWKTAVAYRYDVESQIYKQNAYEYETIIFPLCEKPIVSIIIPVYNQFEYTYQCLKCVKKYSGDIPYEIIVADDHSSDITIDLKHIVKGIHVIRNKENYRFLLNCNHAAKAARGKYIVFLNNDTQVQADWLSALLNTMERDAAIGLAGSKLVYPNGRLQEAGGIVWRDAAVLEYGNNCNPQSPLFNKIREADYISGASIIIRRELWEKLGGFDERFAPAYYEDVDLAFRVREMGYRVVYQPKSEVIHSEGTSGSMENAQKMKIEENRHRFYEKWQNVLEESHCKPLSYRKAVKRMNGGINGK